MAKIDPFKSAQERAEKSPKSSSKSDNKEIVQVTGLEAKLLEYDALKSAVEDINAQLESVKNELKDIATEKFVELYKFKESNPNSFLIKDGDGCIMVVPYDSYISIKDVSRADELIEKYGKEVITVDEKVLFNKKVLDRNMDEIKKLITNSKAISDDDKANLLDVEVKYSISKGYIDKLSKYDDILSVVEDIQPTIALRDCGGRMEEGGVVDSDFIGFVFE
jgi:hypothetical protein